LGYVNGCGRCNIMVRKAARDKQFLEHHHGRWRVVVSVPKSLQKELGATKLKRHLPTDSLAVANELKWAIVKELKDQIRAFERKTFGASRGDRQAVLEQAVELAKALAAHPPQDRGSQSAGVIDETVKSILGHPVRYREVESWMVKDGHSADAGTCIPIYDPDRERLADDFVNAALHGGLPIAMRTPPTRKSDCAFRLAPKTTTIARSGCCRPSASARDWETTSPRSTST